MTSYILTEAIEIAKKSNMFNKHGAVLFYKNNIETIAFNEYDSKYNTKHAEQECINKYKNKIRKYKKDKKKFNLLVIRLSTQNKLLNSKPCHECCRVLKESGIINKIYYSNENGHIITERINNFNSEHKTLLQKKVSNNNSI